MGETYCDIPVQKHWVSSGGSDHMSFLDRGYAAIGGRARVSLVSFRRWWRRRAAWPLREVVGELIEEFVLQQHIAVAVSRYDNRNRRLRFCVGERGWTLLPGTRPSTPGLTPDRLRAAAALLNDLGLLEAVGAQGRDKTYTLADAGDEVLRRFAERSVG